jgi:hypothetical protein
MALHLAARLHAFWHGLFRPTEAAETELLYQDTQWLFADVGIESEEGRAALVAAIAEDVSERLSIPPHHEQATVAHDLVAALFTFDDLFILPEIDDWRAKRTIAQWWDIRDAVNRQKALVADFEATCALISAVASAIIEPILSACPALLDTPDCDGISVPTHLLQSVGNVGVVTEAMLAPILDDEVASILPHLHDRLERNLIAASGGNPADPRSFTRAPKFPSQADAKDPEQLVRSYLDGTPLLPLFDQTLRFTIQTKNRFEHHHIVAGSGHGKTQTLQYLIARDLEAMLESDRSIIVLDSQGDLIRTIAKLKLFAPGQPLHDKIVIIDPSDVEWPVSLNLFDVGMERLSGYAPLERERLTNSILELYDFVLGTLLSAEMTQKQNVIFRYVTRLMLHIPDATIHTLRELMEPGSQTKFAEHIAKLSGTARQFFETEFASKEFEQTKKQVLRRLWGILENQTFERMFSHPRSKLDLFAEMNAGKVILINTAKDLLKEQGTEIFGRFFIALIAQAAQERATLPAHKRTPTIVYVDEAQDYFDRNIGLILAQARKYNVGMVLAHQYLGQLDPKLQEAFAANTAIKFAGGVSAKDARALASMLYCQPEFIEAQPRGSFAAHVRGQTKSAVPLQFPFGHMEAMPCMDGAQRAALQQRMRDRYAVHFSELGKRVENIEVEDDESAEGSSPPEQTTTPKREPRPKPSPPGHIDTDAGETW